MQKSKGLNYGWPFFTSIVLQLSFAGGNFKALFLLSFAVT
jgi:hypothetical protein